MKPILSSASMALLLALSASAFAVPDRAATRDAADVLASIADHDRAFEMSNGQSMQVSVIGGGLRVRYGRRAATLLRPGADGAFVSRDGRISLRFERDDSGEPRRVSLSAPADWL